MALGHDGYREGNTSCPPCRHNSCSAWQVASVFLYNASSVTLGTLNLGGRQHFYRPRHHGPSLHSPLFFSYEKDHLFVYCY